MIIDKMSTSNKPSNEEITILKNSSITNLSLVYENERLFQESFNSLKEFFFEGIFCDVEIRLGIHSIKCHKIVLSSVSGYFKSMFLSDMTESKNGVVNLKDIDSDAVLSLVQYAYTSKILITVENVQTLLFASSILQIESVTKACCEFMSSHLDVTNCLEVLFFANQLGHTFLVNEAQKFITKKFIEVSQNPEFFKLTYELFWPIISSDDLCIYNEENAYETVIKWIKHNITNNAKYTVPLLKNIRLVYCLPSYLVDTISNEELLKRDLDCRDLIDDAKNYCMFKANVISDYKPVKHPKPRKHYSGVMFCVGGRGLDGHPFKTIECYDICHDRWFPVCDMSTRRRHVGVVSVDGKLYAAGGHDGTGHLKSGEVFDPTTNTWTPIADMSKLRRGIALAHLNGSIYAVGGLDDLSCFSTVERYDMTSNTWCEVMKMNHSRGGVALVSYRNNLYAIGGNDGSLSLESCESYDPSLNKWTFLEPMNKRRAGAGATELDGCIYVAGGFDDNAPLDSVERFDVLNNQWTNVTSMSCPRGGVGISSMAGKIFAVGGHDGTNYLESVEEFDPETSKWRHVARIGTCRAGAGVVVVSCHVSSLVDITNSSSTAGDFI